MKLSYPLFITIIVCFLLNNVSFSQDEIKSYSPPDVSEGSNLYLNSAPMYGNINSNEGYSHNDLLVNLDGSYTKWRFTPKLVYSLYVHTRLLFDRYSYTSDYENSYSDVSSYSDVTGGISSYLVKNRFYIGVYNESRVETGTNQDPFQSIHTYPFIGFGYIVNAERVSEMLNLEKVLFDEKIIKKPLSASVKKELTELLDRRNNNEFTDKYRDNADIEFFTQLESILENEGIINSPLSSRTALELFQKLTNSNFVYFPKYKGYLLQIEYENKLEKLVTNRYKNINAMVLSGLYGLPIGLKTELVTEVSLEYLFSDVIGYYNYHFSFHSPLAIQENQQMKKFYNNLTPGLSGLGDNDKYGYVFGTNVLAFYNLTNTAGISGNIGFSAGKKSNGFNYSFRTGGEFIYNILTKLQFNTNISVLKNHDLKYYILISSGFNYYIF